MNRRLIIVIIVVAVLVLGVVTAIAVLTRGSSSNSLNDQPNIVNNQLFIQTDSGPVVTKNIYQSSLTTYPDNGVGFAHTGYYDMSYYPKDNGFIITLLDENVIKANQEAEQDFLKILGITEEQACKLKVTIGVPHNVNPKFAGQVFAFDYCQR